MIIYKVENDINKKLYIGQTRVALNKRWNKHCCIGYALTNAIKKYGKSHFTCIEIDSASSRVELNEKEIHWIKELNSLYPNGYNLTLGGESPEMTEYTKEKLRTCNLGKKASIETKKKMSKSQKIAQLKPSVVSDKKERMSGNKYCVGRKPWNKGKHWSDKMKEQLSEYHKANPSRHIAIKLVNTGEVFKTIREAENKLNISFRTIKRSLDNGVATRYDNYKFVGVLI